jgi:hypothetical protein
MKDIKTVHMVDGFTGKFDYRTAQLVYKYINEKVEQGYELYQYLDNVVILILA